MPTTEQEDTISQFISISGVSEDETEQVESLLTVSNWDLNNALSSYFDNGFNAVSRASNTTSEDLDDYPDALASGPEILENPSELHISRRRVLGAGSAELVNLQNQMFLDSFRPRLPKAPRISNHWQLELGIHSSLAEKIELGQDRRPAVNSWWLVLLLVPRTLVLLLVSLFRFVFTGPARSYIGRFPSRFDYEKYIADYDIKRTIDKEALSDFIVKTSDFNLVFQTAQTSYSWLVLILVDNRSECEQFYQLFFASHEIGELLKTSGTYKDNVVFIGNVEHSPEAHEVGKTYGAKRLPFISLVANVSNDPSIMASMSILYKSNIVPEFLSPELVNTTVKKLAENLSRLMEHYEPQLIAQRFDQREIEYARQLKQQQDDAYVQSLEKDRLKKLEKEQKLQAEQNLQQLAQQKHTFLVHLLQTRWFSNNSNGAETVKIAIKLPHGSRLLETVLKDVSLQQLYLHVETKLYTHELLQKEDYDNEDDILGAALEHTPILHEQYYATFPFKFDLIQPYPKKVLAAAAKSLGEAELAGANLLVEFHEEEEDDDEEEEEDN